MAVIKQSDRPQFFNQRIGINRFSSNSQQPWEALADAAGDIASLTINRMAEDAITKGTEQAESASLLITDENGSPKFLNPPPNLSRTAQKAYQRVIDQRYATKLNNELQLKNKELKIKHPYDAESYSKEFSVFAKTLADTSGPKWGAKINDMSIHMLAMNKLDIESSTANKIFQENKEAVSGISEALLSQISQASNLGEALRDPIDKRNKDPLSVTYYNQLRTYLQESITANLIDKKEANKYLTQAKTSMATGSIDTLLKMTNSKTQRDILLSYLTSGDTSRLARINPQIIEYASQIRQYIDTDPTEGNVDTISAHFKRSAGPINAIYAEDVRLINEQKKLYDKKYKAYYNSAVEINKLKLEATEKDRKNKVKLHLANRGLTETIDIEILSMENLQMPPSVDRLGVYATQINSIKNERIKYLESALKAEDITDTKYRQYLNEVNNSVAKSVLDLFRNDIKFTVVGKKDFQLVLNGEKAPDNLNQAFAAEAIAAIFGSDTKGLKTFINEFKPSEEAVIRNKLNVHTEYGVRLNNVLTGKENSIEEFSSFMQNKNAQRFLTTTQKTDAIKEIQTSALKNNLAINVANLDSTDLNSLNLLIKGQSSTALEFSQNPQKIIEIAKETKDFLDNNPEVSKDTISSYLTGIEVQKEDDERASEQFKIDANMRSNINAGVIDATVPLSDYQKYIDEAIGNNLIEAIQSPTFTNALRTYGSKTLNTALKNVVSGNFEGRSNDDVQQLITTYMNDSRLRRGSTVYNNWTTKGFLSQNEATHLETMMLIKNQPGNENLSWAEISLGLKEAQKEKKDFIKFADSELPTVTSGQILKIASGTNASDFYQKKPIYYTKPVFTAAQRNFENKYKSVVQFYMNSNLDSQTIINRMEDIFENEFRVSQDIVIDPDGESTISNILNGDKLETSMPIEKYFQDENETNWFVNLVEENLNSIGYSLKHNKQGYKRAVLEPELLADGPVQSYVPYHIENNNLIPLIVERSIFPEMSPDDLQEQELHLPRYPTFSNQLMEFREQETERKLNTIADAVQNSATVLNEPLSNKIIKGFGKSALGMPVNIEANMEKSNPLYSIFNWQPFKDGFPSMPDFSGEKQRQINKEKIGN